MKLVLITKDFYKSTIIGPVISIKNYLKSSVKKNKIIIIDHNSTNKIKIKKKNLEIVFIKNFFSAIKNIIKINQIIKKSDQVDIHSFFDFVLFFQIIFLCFLNNKKIKIYLRGMVNDNVIINKKILKKLYIFIANFFLKKALIVCTSQYELSISRKYFKKNRFIIENNKVSNEYINIKFQKLLKNKKNLKILFYSNISWKKNFTFVYEVLRELDFKVELNIYGKCIIPRNFFNKMLLELRKKHSVNYFGYSKSLDKKNIFHSSHLFFLPTLDENFGHAIVESFLHHRPCLLSSNTPWNDNQKYNAGFSVMLNKKYRYRAILKEFYFMNQSSFDTTCLASKKYILMKLKNTNY
jgi:hypothetical protein